MRAGLLGRTLGHSFSPQIHAMLSGDYSYALFEREPEALEKFLKGDEWDALNVTIPYKRDVIPYCTELSETVRQIGSVNTLVRRPDNSIFGDNTDAAGFSAMLDMLDVNPEGKKALVLGSGGASLTVQYVLRSRGAEVFVISRRGKNNYDNLDRHADAQLLVNTTPVGMYPDNGVSPVNLDGLPELRGVLDVVYNPARTQLMLDAEARGIPCVGGLLMLVEQARAASERFTGKSIPSSRTQEILSRLRAQTLNLILIGMPACGKTTVGEILAQKMDREFVDVDDVVELRLGMSIPEYFETHCEAEFRFEETEALKEVCKRSSLVIATGGGCITQPRNMDILRQNGIVLFLERELALLSKRGRPISQRSSLEELYAVRKPLYLAFADAVIASTGIPEKTADKMLEVYYEISGS